MLRRIFEPKSEERTELCNLYSSLNIFWAITSRRAGDMMQIERKKGRDVYVLFGGKP
jgi:hypothetical protein